MNTTNGAGRQSLLASLRAAFAARAGAGHLEVLAGPSGIGKTYLARTYLQQRAKDYAWVGWLRAYDPALLASDYLQLATSGPRAAPGPAAPIDPASIRQRLARTADWLLIFDGARGPEDVEEYLPKPLTGHVLVTSRTSRWLPLASPRPVPPLTQDDVAAIVRSGGQPDRAALSLLAGELAALPSLVVLAAAYLRVTRASAAEYRATLRRVLARRPPGAPGGASDAAALTSAVLALTLDRLASRAPGAANLLCLAAFLGADEIDRAFLASCPLPLPEDLARVVSTDSDWKAAIDVLGSFGLATTEGARFAVVPFLLAALRDQLGDAGRRSWAELAAHVVCAAFRLDPNRPETWVATGALLGHSVAAAGWAQTLQVALDPAARLLNYTGLALARQGLWQPSRDLLSRSYALAQQVYGPNHLTVATAAANLALVSQQTGDPDAARRYAQQAVEITESFYHPRHLAVAGPLVNLAGICEATGAFEAAREHLLRARSTYAAAGDRAGQAAMLQRLAALAARVNATAEARENLIACLQIQEEGGDRAGAAGTLTQLALAAAKEGNSDAASGEFERALGYYRALGDRAGEAFALNQLGVLVGSAGDAPAGLRLAALSYLLYESLGRAEAEISYQNLARLAAQSQLAALRVAEVVEEVGAAYRRAASDSLLEAIRRPAGALAPPTPVGAVQRQKLVAMLLVKNEERYIGRALDHLSGYVDEIVVLDDGSTDRTVEICRSFPKVADLVCQEGPFHEGRSRNRLLEMALARSPDWLLTLDGDEVFEETIREALPILMNPPDPTVRAYAFPVYHFWRGTGAFRVDPPWGGQLRVRLTRAEPGMRFPELPMHVAPIPVGCEPTQVHRARVRLKHYRFSDYDDTVRRYEWLETEDKIKDAVMWTLTGSRRASEVAPRRSENLRRPDDRPWYRKTEEPPDGGPPSARGGTCEKPPRTQRFYHCSMARRGLSRSLCAPPQAPPGRPGVSRCGVRSRDAARPHDPTPAPGHRRRAEAPPHAADASAGHRLWS